MASHHLGHLTKIKISMIQFGGNRHRHKDDLGGMSLGFFGEFTVQLDLFREGTYLLWVEHTLGEGSQ